MTEPKAGQLLICARCCELKGQVPNDAGHQQLCGCATTEERDAQPKWGDLNLYAELCYCCGLQLVRSGSRWSLFFCEWCKGRVVDLNESAGRCVIPIGRHSIMNGVFLDPARIESEDAVAKFVKRMGDVFGRIEVLEKWARAVVVHNIAALGFEQSHDVAVADYLAAAGRSALSKEYAF